MAVEDVVSGYNRTYMKIRPNKIQSHLKKMRFIFARELEEFQNQVNVGGKSRKFTKKNVN